MIRDRDKFMKSLWDWDLFKGCFPRGIKPSDMDGWVEVNGRFLFIEAKGPGVPIPQGQLIGFQRLATKPGCVVLVLWGEPGKPERFLLLPHMQSGECDAGRVRAFAEGWAKWAESVPRADQSASFTVTVAERVVAEAATEAPDRWETTTTCPPGCMCQLCGELGWAKAEAAVP